VAALLLQVSAVKDALRRMLIPGGLDDELTRARNFYMLTTGAQPHHWSVEGNIRSGTSRHCRWSCATEGRTEELGSQKTFDLNQLNMIIYEKSFATKSHLLPTPGAVLPSLVLFAVNITLSRCPCCRRAGPVHGAAAGEAGRGRAAGRHVGAGPAPGAAARAAGVIAG